MTYIAIVDDKRAIRQALEEKLNLHDRYEVLFTAENGKDFLEKMAEARRAIEPDVVLMDIDMPVMNGIQAVEQGKERYPGSRYLMLTIFDEDDKIFSAIRAGASGYLLKDEPLEKIKEAITQLLEHNGAPMSPSIARRALNMLMHTQVEIARTQKTQLEDYSLTDRETQVLEWLVQGMEYKEIAMEMNVSPNTIRNHVSSIYKKLHVTSRAQAIRVYMKNQEK